MNTLESHIASCTSDIYDAIATGKYTLDMQVRAYDLLDSLMIGLEAGVQMPQDEAGETFCKVYMDNKDRLEQMIDDTVLKNDAEERMRPYAASLEEMHSKAQAAMQLHELAKETFAIWQSSGIFARQKALRRLRKSAGFRLESHRIGNYVAKTYDLMEEARRAHQKAQQALFSANVAYKCHSGVLNKIHSILQ